MRQLCIIILLFVYTRSFAQKADNQSLQHAVAQLNTALLARDTVTLKRLLHEHLGYGHSNGWIETKKEVMEDLYNGTLVYNKIEQGRPEIVIDGNAAAVRATADIDVLVKGTQVQMKLQILQVWIWRNKEWVLFGRQSVKAKE